MVRRDEGRVAIPKTPSSDVYTFLDYNSVGDLPSFKGGQAVSIEQRILNIDLENAYYCGKELRAIALDVRKLEDRIKQLEQENDALRADLLLWDEKEVK
jgi:hypothetical protein